MTTTLKFKKKKDSEFNLTEYPLRNKNVNVGEIYEHPLIRNEDRKRLFNYINRLNRKGKINIGYTRKGYNGSLYGRYFPIDGSVISCTNMWRRARATLYGETEYDIDIVNCIPTILLELILNQSNLTEKDVPNLVNYVKYRDSIIADIIIDDDYINIYNKKTLSDVNKKDIIKNLFTIILFGGSINTWKEKWEIEDDDYDLKGYYDGFKSDISKISEIIINIPKYSEMIRNIEIQYRMEGRDCSNYKLLAIILQDIERQIVDIAMEHFKNIEEFEITAYVYDGFQIRPKNGKSEVKEIINNELEKIHKKIDECMDYKTVRFIIKEFVEPLDLREGRRSFNIHIMNILEDTSNEKKIKELKEKIESDEYEDKIEIKKELKKLEDQQNEKTFILKKEYFELFNCKIKNPVGYIIESYGELQICKYGELKEIYSNVFIDKKPFVTVWKKRADILEKHKITFKPPPLQTSQYEYNTFKGFVVENYEIDDKDCDYNILLDHIDILTGGLGKTSDQYKFLHNYLAHMIQKPGVIPETAILFKSKQGVGKNLFFEAIGNMILGEKYLLQTSSMDHVFGRFNAANERLLIIMDETKGSDSFKNDEKIKNQVTAKNVKWEQKGVSLITIENYARLIFCSNNDVPVKIDPDDRRFVAYNPSSEKIGNKRYFNELAQALENKSVMKAFYNYLKSVDIENWDPRDKKTHPVTGLYKSLQSVNVPTVIRFVDYYMFEYKNDTKKDTKKDLSSYKAMKLYTLFVNWCGRVGIKSGHILSMTCFGNKIKEINGIISKRSNKGNLYYFDFDKIKKYFSDEGYEFFLGIND